MHRRGLVVAAAVQVLVGMRGDARHARDDEERVGGGRGDADIAADGGDRAVDVHGERRALSGPLDDHHLHRPDHLDVLSLHLELERHLEQPRGARIARVEAVAEAGDPFFLLFRLLDDRQRRVVIAGPLPDPGQPGIQKVHARLDVAAVIAAESKEAGGDAGAQRRAGGRGVARGERRGGCGAVVDERHQHRFHQAGDRRRRRLAHQQQVDRLAESQPSHHLVEGIAADEDLVRFDAGQRRTPLVIVDAAMLGPAFLDAGGRSFVRCHGVIFRTFTAYHTAGRRNRRVRAG